ncbi:MAG: phage tail family protein [Clostridiales bacterium]|nr:phage tail family protein [Clostridiales bacterium]
MFGIKFYNDCGTVNFGGGADLNSWRVTGCDGLAVPGRSFTVCRYAGIDGQTTVASRREARTVTLSGDFYAGGEGETAYKRALSVLGKSGTLEVKSMGETRRTEAACASFTERGRQGNYRLFTVQFVCDSPYFESAVETEVPLYKTIPLLDSDFTFPGKFSERITRTLVVNGGDSDAEPIFHITAGHNPLGILTIVNHTTNQRLSINYEPLADEIITVDVAARRIYSSGGNNLLNCLSDDSFFDGFTIVPGGNDIEVVIGESNRELAVSCRFRNRYSEAVC